MPLDFRASAQPDLKVYDLGHLGLSPLHLGVPSGAGGQAPGPQLGSPSRDRGAPTGGGAILPPGGRGVRNVGGGCGMWDNWKTRPFAHDKNPPLDISFMDPQNKGYQTGASSQPAIPKNPPGLGVRK